MLLVEDHDFVLVVASAQLLVRFLGEAFYQHAVHAALREAYDATLSKGVVIHKSPQYQEKRLSQVADYLCAVELAAVRYDSGDVSPTYDKFFGSRKMFRANYLKQARRKAI